MTGKPGGNKPKRAPGPPQRPVPAGSRPGRNPPAGRPPNRGRPAGPEQPSRPGRPSRGRAGLPSPSRVTTAVPPSVTRSTGRPPAPGKPPARQPSAAVKRKEEESPRALLELYRPDLARILEAADAPTFRYAQVLEHVLRHPASPFSEASALPADLRPALDDAGISVLTVTASRKAPDGTTKLLLAAADGAQVEAVLMPYGRRLTVCISSQVGCAVGCAFCATGAMGFRRNLTTAEIVDQLRAAAAAAEGQQRISNVVYMGMGEPLLNLGSVLDSVRVLTARAGLGLGHRALSISTIGIPSGILRLARTEPQVNLAVSLHAADDATRALLVPEGFRRPLAEILEAAWQHFDMTRRKLLIEYVLIAGVNDSVDDAKRLAALLRGHVVTVNLLTWNPVRPEEIEPLALAPAPPGARAGHGRGVSAGSGQGAGRVARVGPAGLAGPARSRRAFFPSSPSAVAAFRSTLRAVHIETVVRQSKGAGIEAACGQLAGTARSYDDN
jgi:23S rRNA (adenine2503-C2)-methyltransferase